VSAGRDHLVDQYLDALSAELKTVGAAQPVRSIFLGGGTPTHLDPARLGRLLGEVMRWFAPLDDCEFTVEANPETLSQDKIKVLSLHGVNRISLGVQSFQPHLLRVLERGHQAADIGRVVEIIRTRIPHVSLDLMFATPGQSLADWDADLRHALALEPSHISTYGLTYEKGTPFWKRLQTGALHALDEESERRLYARALDVLREAGYDHYEISNHALPGCQSRHNAVYWANEAYFGFGMGAARYLRGRREMNTRDLDGYMRSLAAGRSPVFHSEELSSEDRARETMALQLRRSQGINRKRFVEQTAHELDSLAGPALAHHVALGFLTDDAENVRLTREGVFVADTVIRNLL
jgi:oxygen-independent coproporphyrinogen-3 oxidase